MTQVTIYENKMIILMKSGLIHWVSKETGDRASEHLSNQQGHSFMKIRELGNITINTAEMEAVYNHRQYEDLCRVKSGEWQCAYGKWHMKRGNCTCKGDHNRLVAESIRRTNEAIQNRPLTPEEVADKAERLRTTSEMRALDGVSVFRNMFVPGIRENVGRVIRKKTILRWEKERGQEADLTGLQIEDEE